MNKKELKNLIVNEKSRITSQRKLKDLIEGESSYHKIQGSEDRLLTSVCSDSRRVVDGSAFFALPGNRTSGEIYVDEAINRGARLVVTENENLALPPKVTMLKVKDSRKAMAKFAKKFYNSPDYSLSLVGVTGTNGKTTVTTLTRYLLERAGNPVGLVGTVNYNLGDREIPSFKTTPESTDIYPMLKSMLAAGCRQAVMEVSSHGIHQSRVSDLNLEVSAFLNLTHDHLDYHGNMEDYYREKRKIFNGVNGPLPKVAVINGDCPYGKRLAEELPPQVQVLTFGFGAENHFRATGLSLNSQQSSFLMECPAGNLVVTSPMIGKYNVLNALASFSIIHALGESVSDSVHKLTCFGGVSGRMEVVDRGQPFRVLVDYAHTPDALKNALEMLQECTSGKVRVVFGCGGDRDRGKRLEMTRIACAVADQVWATADNPRTEGINSIFDDMKKGVCKGAEVFFVEDRRRAIRMALESASKEDCVLIAGKGHEVFQEIHYTAIPFDDRLVASELLDARMINY